MAAEQGHAGRADVPSQARVPPTPRRWRRTGHLMAFRTRRVPAAWSHPTMISGTRHFAASSPLAASSPARTPPRVLLAHRRPNITMQRPGDGKERKQGHLNPAHRHRRNYLLPETTLRLSLVGPRVVVAPRGTAPAGLGAAGRTRTT